MPTRSKIAFLLMLSAPFALADKNDTSIVIKKGEVPANCTEYQIIDGKEEVFGAPEYDRKKAYASWKTACDDWKKSMKEMNKDNSLLTLNCANPTGSKDGEMWLYKGVGSYKVKTKTREPK